jgi:hypothetical protein
MLEPCLIASRPSICLSILCLTNVFFALSAAFSSRAWRPASTISRARDTCVIADRDLLEERKCSTCCSNVGCLSQMLSLDEFGEGGAGGEVAMVGEEA